ncbi:hypothetical protein SUGI_0232620 [Cryptomeria japonica]|uniref:oleoyl-acyl carrier protein thioesterase, chloroplastic n=1 Tax=Cryptomeria japonica TaxID=3369 RepID=UPI002408DBFD|nr:oleoyl-acyl carrier protein thioesterase, chloroplastic [Cryptomeria japonica]GLJ14400.1 hypothetical protein SUGI_0232620 [Cryptomeria japonica]
MLRAVNWNRPWKSLQQNGSHNFCFTAKPKWSNAVHRKACFRVEISASYPSNARICDEDERVKLEPIDRSQTKSLADRLRPGGLTADGLSYKENFTIRCYEVGVNRTATIEAVANLLQEVACNHAQSVGFSTDGFATTPTMRKHRLIWVTARMHIEVYKYPVWGDVVEIETWCQAEGKIGTRRDWILKDATTKVVIGRATSTWVMMNQDTRRLSRVTDEVRDEYMIYCPKVSRLAFPEENSNSSKKIPKLKDPAEHSRSGLMPRRADLDMNKHVNNVTYIGWVLESMPQEVLESHELQTITLDYRRECNKDDVVESLTSSEPSISENGAVVDGFVASKGIASTNGSATVRSPAKDFEFLHMLRLDDGGFEINRGRTVWRRKLVR